MWRYLIFLKRNLHPESVWDLSFNVLVGGNGRSLTENVPTKDCLKELATAFLTNSEKFRDTGGENVLKNLSFLSLG